MTIAHLSPPPPFLPLLLPRILILLLRPLVTRGGGGAGHHQGRPQPLRPLHAFRGGGMCALPPPGITFSGGGGRVSVFVEEGVQVGLHLGEEAHLFLRCVCLCGMVYETWVWMSCEGILKAGGRQLAPSSDMHSQAPRPICMCFCFQCTCLFPQARELLLLRLYFAAEPRRL